MNQDIVPRPFRILVWVIAIAVFALIVLTGYIAVQVEDINREVDELRLTV